GGQSIEERLAALRAQQPQPTPGFLENLSIGGQRFLRGVADATQTAYELGREALHGNFQPLRETAELAARGAAPVVSALVGGPYKAGLNYIGESAVQQAPIAAVEAQRQARREAGPDAAYWQRSAADIARLDALAAQDPSLAGKLTRGGVKLGGDVLLAGLSGG